MEVNGSGFAMGAVLMQEQEGEWKPLTHMSKTYNPAEQNYHTGDRELLAIIKALKQWRQHLVGNGHFEIWTNHWNLTYFQKPQNINHQQAGWVQKCRNMILLYIIWKERKIQGPMHYLGEKEK